MANLNTNKNAKTKKDFGHEKIEILYSDETICVINKPSGLLSVPYPGSRIRTAQSILEEIMHKNGTFSSSHRPFAVHRLDRDTSGVMLFALTENAQKKIMDTWHQMVTERLYRAVAENPRNKKLILPDCGLIDDELAFNAHNVGFVPKESENSKNNSDSYGENRRLKQFRHAQTIKFCSQVQHIRFLNFHSILEKRTRFALILRQKAILLQETKITGPEQTILAGFAFTPEPWNLSIRLRAKK